MSDSYRDDQFDEMLNRAVDESYPKGTRGPNFDYLRYDDYYGFQIDWNVNNPPWYDDPVIRAKFHMYEKFHQYEQRLRRLDLLNYDRFYRQYPKGFPNGY